MMPTAAAAMGMKLIASRCSRRFGYRQVLVVNTVLIGVTIGLFALVGAGHAAAADRAARRLRSGFFNSLQFSSMNSMAYADIDARRLEHGQHHRQHAAADVAELRPGRGSLVAAWFLGDLPQTDRLAVTRALHHAFLTLGRLTLLSSLSFWTLRPTDGDNVSRRASPSPVSVSASLEA